ncbi:hypothetical protein FJ251_10385, partial [bacterium]|nr:hypothetical protein [bacterium]
MLQLAKFTTRLIALALALAGLTGAAAAFTPASQNDLYEIRLPAYDTLGGQSFGRDVGMLQAAQTLEARYGGRWSVYAWNNLSGTPRHAYGPAVPLAASVGDAAALESLARTVIAANADVLGADNAELRLVAAPHALGKWVAHFQQTVGGIDVAGARLRVAISESGKLLLLGSDCFAEIPLAMAPSLGAAAAEAIAIGALPFDAATDAVTEKPRLLVLPVALSETAVEHHLVWRLTVRTAEPLGKWVTDVDAHTGEILQRLNDIHFAYGGGTAMGAQVYGWCDGESQVAIPYLRINVSGLGSTNSDAAGNWTLAGSGGPRAVTADLFGPYVSVDNFPGANALFSGTVLENLPLTVSFTDLNARQDERDTFDAVNDVHDFFALFDPGFAYPNTRINAYVNRADGYCPGNAWWDGTINFCAAGGGFANTGELQQVVHHEFGHGVQAAILGYQGEQGLGEGNSDILGNLITQDPVIGRGFYTGNCASGIRNSLNTLQYPADVIGQPIHSAGRVIAGFNWDAMVLLQAELGGGAAWNAPGTVASAERWHFGRVLLLPTTQPDQVFATFFADDDNDNLEDGTPHYDSFCAAAENHGFTCPERLIGVLFAHTPVGDTMDTANPYPVTTQVVSTYAPIEASSVTLHWRKDGGAWTAVAMAHDGGDSYSASIPAQESAQIDYYLTAADAIGTVGSEPDGAPAAFHSFMVAWLIDPLESAAGWTVNPDGNDGAAASSAWVHVDPIGSAAQPEDDHTPAGTLCWVTGQANDVDTGRTTLLSPVFDLTGAVSAALRYWKWFVTDSTNDEFDVWLSNDGGATWLRVEHDPNGSPGWESVTHDLAALFGAPALLRIKVTAEDFGAVNEVEAALDDLAILASFDDLTGVGDGLEIAFPVRLEQNRPNPFNPLTEIRYSLPAAGPARLAVYDARP